MPDVMYYSISLCSYAVPLRDVRISVQAHTRTVVQCVHCAICACILITFEIGFPNSAF